MGGEQTDGRRTDDRRSSNPFISRSETQHGITLRGESNVTATCMAHLMQMLEASVAFLVLRGRCRHGLWYCMDWTMKELGVNAKCDTRRWVSSHVDWNR